MLWLLFCSRQDRLVLDVGAIQILMIIRESRTAPQENLWEKKKLLSDKEIYIWIQPIEIALKKKMSRKVVCWKCCSKAIITFARALLCLHMTISSKCESSCHCMYILPETSILSIMEFPMDGKYFIKQTIKIVEYYEYMHWFRQLIILNTTFSCEEKKFD